MASAGNMAGYWAVETIVVTEKWGTDGPNAVTDSWIEPFNGDFQPDIGAYGGGRAWTVTNRHIGFADCVFFDGHASAMRTEDILNSQQLTGCELVYLYPFTNYDANTPTVTSISSQNTANPPVEPNDCANPRFNYPKASVR